MKFKKFVVAMLCVAMVGMFAACGGGSSDSGSGDASGAITINIWDANQQEGIQEICNDWTAQGNPEVKVEVIDWDNYWTLLEAGASGGELPDVFWMHSDYAQIYMENDVLLDLTEYIEKDGIDLGQYYPDITAIYQSDGKTYALPKDHDTIALLYNKALFDEAGVDYPTDDWTYEDMYEAAKTITEKTADDTYGFALNTSNDQDGWYNYVYAYGANIVNTEKTDTAIDSAEGKAAMEMVRKLLTVGTPQAVVSESGTDSLFQSGKVAMITQGSWMINAFYTAENHDDYAWAQIPYCDRNGDGQCQKEERQTCYNGLGWAAAANTKNPDAAARDTRCWSIGVGDWSGEPWDELFLEFRYTGNCARLYENGRLLDDHIYTGPDCVWEVGLSRFGKGRHELVLEVDALGEEDEIFLEKWPSFNGEPRLVSLDSVCLRGRLLERIFS